MLTRVNLFVIALGLLATAGWAAPLAPCPDSPNCVSSVDSREGRRIAPLVAGSDAISARDNLLAVLDASTRVQWQAEGDNIIRAQFTSALFRFVDDVQFVIREDGTVDVRSASRVGYWDLGANRRRVEHLRDALADRLP